MSCATVCRPASILLLVVAFFTASDGKRSPYCSLNCLNDYNILCKGPDVACRPRICSKIVQDFPKYVQQSVLSFMNTIRNSVALGEWSAGSQAANMTRLSWSKELEFISECLSNQICDLDDLQVDYCLKAQNFKNLAYIVSTTSASNRNLRSELGIIRSMINDWFDHQALFFTNKSLKGFPATRVISNSESMNIGCFRSVTDLKTDMKSYVFVCVFDGYNKEETPPYKVGPACSACPKSMSCSTTQYRGLCAKSAKMRMLKEYVKPFKISGRQYGLSDGRRAEKMVFFVYLVLSKFILA